MVVLEVGESFTWIITADLTEDLTVYTPVALPNSAVATLSPQTQFTAHAGVYTLTAVAPGENTLLYLDCQTDGKLLVAKLFPQPVPGGPDYGPLGVCEWSENLADHSFNGVIVNEALQMGQQPGLAILVGGNLAPPNGPNGGTPITGNALFLVTPEEPEGVAPIFLSSQIYGFELPPGTLLGAPQAGGF